MEIVVVGITSLNFPFYRIYILHNAVVTTKTGKHGLRDSLPCNSDSFGNRLAGATRRRAMSGFRMPKTIRRVFFATSLTFALVTCAASQQAIPAYNDPQQAPAPTATALAAPATPASSAPADTEKARKLGPGQR